MREILFRGKRIDNGGWAFGTYYNQEYFYGVAERKPYIITSNECLQNDIALEYTEVIQETVGLFTGLADKNGKRIFEGDIVSVTGLTPHPTWEYDSVTGVVEWCCGAFGVEGRENDDYAPYGWLYDSCAACREIIGNIHDNPELLEAPNA